MSTPPLLPSTMRVFERGWLSANNILFIDDAARESALVDTGYVTHAAQTEALVAAALDGRPLTHIINTHLHSDHCGGNAALQARWQPRTAIPAAEAAAVASWDHVALSFDATGQQCARFGFDAVLQDGGRLRLGGIDWDVVAAPGHDPHAVMLFAPSHGILISGDALWERGFGVIFPELDGESGFVEQAAVLDRIAALDARIVIPGHGRPFDDAKGAISHARSRLDYLQADGARNAIHAVRVLVKFKLLELQTVSREALFAWMRDTPLMQRIHARFMAAQSIEDVFDQTLRALAKAGALTTEGDQVRNQD
ncbi:MBL fold metallo-hydrolase [Cupriavidus metallidurans]|uniref:MBL fold metallo-hydrolase n=1 Tax=Cupriavidus TaxID=106589 RepID=UPI000E7E3C56|nr:MULTISPECIES: MBL fold metallo-hydrolase [unclassified Cupriavidus]GMG91976.1 hypothetical protein Cmtc_31960 [Cupriavidus sp. TKC]HBD35388.1 MBL fold metallo-hydrolase [Cupriavidus sp.]HBO81128.1 MBL fold metallo-hydrolase [Cupriavidus sp.]